MEDLTKEPEKKEPTPTPEPPAPSTEDAIKEALKTAKVEWEKGLEKRLKAERDEASKLAKLSKEDREKAEEDKERNDYLEEKAKFQAERLMFETEKQLKERQFPTGFAKLVCGSDADDTKEKIENLDELLKEYRQEIVNELTKGTTPKGATTKTTQITQEQFDLMSYSEKVELFNTNQKEYERLTGGN